VRVSIGVGDACNPMPVHLDFCQSLTALFECPVLGPFGKLNR
jgi:hypothetical protein